MSYNVAISEMRNKITIRIQALEYGAKTDLIFTVIVLSDLFLMAFSSEFLTFKVTIVNMLLVAMLGTAKVVSHFIIKVKTVDTLLQCKDNLLIIETHVNLPTASKALKPGQLRISTAS